MTSAPSRLNALIGSWIAFAVFLTVLFPFHAAYAKIKGIAQEACDIAEEEFKVKIVEDVLSAKTLCGEGVTPEHTGGYTCNKIALKDCKKTRIRCVTQFICPAEETVKPELEVVLLGSEKPGSPKSVEEKTVTPQKPAPTVVPVKAFTPPPAGQPMNEGKVAAASTVTNSQAQPKIQPQASAQPKVEGAPSAPPAAAAVGASSAPAAVQPLPTPVPPPAFKPMNAVGNAVTASPTTTQPVQAATTPSAEPAGAPVAAKVEKLVKPIDIQQIDLESFTQGQKTPGLPDFATMGAGLMALGSGILIGTIAMVLFFMAALWRLFEKAGHSGVAAIIPIYNMYKLHKIAGQPGWWFIVDLIPIAGFISVCLMNKKLSEKFSTGQGVMIIMILFAPIGYAIVAFSSKYQYASGDAVPQGLEGADPKAVAQWQEIKMIPPEDQ